MNKILYKEISDCLNKDLSLMEDRMKSLLLEEANFDIGFQKDVLNFLFTKSKRLRPLSIFLVKDSFKSSSDKLIDLAVALELLHNATLVHDDIIDEAEIRRLEPSFNFKYNSKIAVILGDYLLSLSLKLLSKIGSPTVFSYFSDNTLKICKGEINQFFNKEKTVQIEEYLEKSKNKTSSLFLCGVKSALHLIDKENPVYDEQKNAVLDFISNFSLAFQIYDDIENFKSDFETPCVEKQSSDIKNGIYTLPLLYISQQNYLYDIINLNKDTKIYKNALEFSKNYKDEILNVAQNSIMQLNNEYNTNLFIKLADVFKN